MPNRSFTASIPEHLKPYIVEQDASMYTAIDQAAWRYILRVSSAFFSENAHQKYLDGLRETGVNTDRIPLISEIDECLKNFGWRAVAVSGFIPPAAFMEFQSLGILPIACDMRTLEHIAYTPAPDIVHEAAGHAPIIADPEYAKYLREYGEVSRKAIFSSKDLALYEAIRNLSEVKENPASTDADIESAQKRLSETVSSVDYVSESSYLSRMYWWTVEYGLVGDINQPKIYGAGLLSSVGESFACLSSKVQKIPFTLDCMNRSYDITRPQPQLFVSKDFHVLTESLKQYAETMAFRRGGLEGLTKAVAGAALSTTVFETGIQISGIVEQAMTDHEGDPAFIRFKGPAQLSFNDQELQGHSARYHSQGFSCPVGALASGQDVALLLQSAAPGQDVHLRYRSGIELKGRFKNAVTLAGKTLIGAFDRCTITWGEKTLYDPSWGPFDLAVGTKVTSVFGGVADFKSYYEVIGLEKKAAPKQKTNLTASNSDLNSVYQKIRDWRDSSQKSEADLVKLHEKLNRDYPQDWLSRLELLELAQKAKPSLESMSKQLKTELQKLMVSDKRNAELISRGIELLS